MVFVDLCEQQCSVFVSTQRGGIQRGAAQASRRLAGPWQHSSPVDSCCGGFERRPHTIPAAELTDLAAPGCRGACFLLLCITVVSALLGVPWVA